MKTRVLLTASQPANRWLDNTFYRLRRTATLFSQAELRVPRPSTLSREEVRLAVIEVLG